MSRSGRIPVSDPENTDVEIKNGVVHAKGKLGEQSFDFQNHAKVSLKDKLITVEPAGDSKFSLQMWGTVRSRISNLLTGVSKGFSKELELNGVGYKANQKGDTLELLLGYSHPINFEIPNGIKVDVPKPTSIIISGSDKQRVGQVAANIREFRNKLSLVLWDCLARKSDI